MTHFLLIGCSRFARRRVLPALAGLDEVAAVHVASRRAGDAELAAVPKRGRVSRDYEQALADAPRGLAYVSLTNDAHAHWVERALAHGHHVVVDKPAFVALADAERLVAVARARGLVLAEAITWPYHPQVAQLRQMFADRGREPQHVTATLAPAIPADDVRMQRALGGGALLDVGPYFASLGRTLWGAAPVSLHAHATRTAEVDTAFGVLADYGGGRRVVGHFGFVTEYRNWLHLAAAGLAVEAHGVFSTGPDVETELVVRERDAITTTRAPAAFAMQLFLADVLAAIARGDATTHGERLLGDARVLDALRRAAAQPARLA